jgi:hypothetical protein
MDLAEQWRAVGCTTWGELRDKCTPEVYQEVLGVTGHGTYEDFSKYLLVGRPIPGVDDAARRQYSDITRDLPSDDTAFEASVDIPAHASGDWPPSQLLLMRGLLPDEIIRRYGRCYETTINGEFVEFEPARSVEILGALRELGYTCTEDQELISASDPGSLGL